MLPSTLGTPPRADPGGGGGDGLASPPLTPLHYLMIHTIRPGSTIDAQWLVLAVLL